MKRLTKRERAQVLKAAEFIHDGKTPFMCTTLHSLGDADCTITWKLAEFYNNLPGYDWLPTLNPHSSEAIEIRVLALLTFAEVG